MEISKVVKKGVPRYKIDFPELGVEHVYYDWATTIGDHLKNGIVELMRETTAAAPIIGFGVTIDDSAANAYIEELRKNLAEGKCRLLTIYSDIGELMGLCTLKRNLNPNNSHITDLAKGMIAAKYRGHLVLPAAFYEIAAMCERDGVEMVTLDVRANTPAHRSWDYYGFKTYGVLPDYARSNGVSFSGHFMMQKVSDLKIRVLRDLCPKEGDALPRSVL
jgi:hypothetical protein